MNLEKEMYEALNSDNWSKTAHLDFVAVAEKYALEEQLELLNMVYSTPLKDMETYVYNKRAIIREKLKEYENN